MMNVKTAALLGFVTLCTAAVLIATAFFIYDHSVVKTNNCAAVAEAVAQTDSSESILTLIDCSPD